MDTPDFLGDDPRLAAFSEGVDSAEKLWPLIRPHPRCAAAA